MRIVLMAASGWQPKNNAWKTDVWLIISEVKYVHLQPTVGVSFSMCVSVIFARVPDQDWAQKEPLVSLRYVTVTHKASSFIQVSHSWVSLNQLPATNPLLRPLLPLQIKVKTWKPFCFSFSSGALIMTGKCSGPAAAAEAQSWWETVSLWINVSF